MSVCVFVCVILCNTKTIGNNKTQHMYHASGEPEVLHSRFCIYNIKIVGVTVRYYYYHYIRHNYVELYVWGVFMCVIWLCISINIIYINFSAMF